MDLAVVFDIIDADGSGYIDAEEFDRVLDEDIEFSKVRPRVLPIISDKVVKTRKAAQKNVSDV